MELQVREPSVNTPSPAFRVPGLFSRFWYLRLMHIYLTEVSEKRPLTYRPVLLWNTTLLSHILLTLVWVILLSLALAIKSPLNGSTFLLGGFSAGYISSALKFLAGLQLRALGQLIPYLSMASRDANDIKASCTVVADYFPYDYPCPRLRPILNGHSFFFFADLATFLGTSTLVQFSSNILHPVYGTHSGVFRGWLPNRAIIFIVIGCHTVLMGITLVIMMWLYKRETGLLDKPGSLATMSGMLQGGVASGNGVCGDFAGLDAEDRRWEIRKKLENKTYRLGYWRREGSDSGWFYGIGRPEVGTEGQGETITSDRNPLPPRFSYIPWFLRPLGLSIAIVILTVLLAVALTLICSTDALQSGFAPHGSTALSPSLMMSSAGFLWSFIPSFAADIYGLLFKNIDAFYRVTQPYVDLLTPGVSPQQSVRALILNYTSDLPVVVTFKALRNRHWMVAFSSCVSLVAAFAPALAANMFYPDFDDNGDPRIFISQNPFFIVVALMGFHLLSLMMLMPEELRGLPHDLEPLSDHFSFLCGSSLLSDERFLFDKEEMYVPKRAPQPRRQRLKAMKDRLTQLVRDLKEPSHEERVQRRFVADDGFHVGFGFKDGAAVVDRLAYVVLPYTRGELQWYFWHRLKEIF
jgi:Protein of unknown function (DUF3433)